MFIFSFRGKKKINIIISARQSFYEKVRGPKSFKKNLKKSLFISFHDKLPPLSPRKEPFPYQYSGGRERHGRIFASCDASVPNESTRGQVSVALPPIINF